MPTKIAWTDETWNPVVGCSKVSEGCKNCYAEKMAYRLWCMGNGAYGSVMDIETNGWNGKVFCRKDRLEIPLHWRKPRMIFICSMGDLFHESVPFDFISQVFDVIRQGRKHIYQILTKRPERMADFIFAQWPQGFRQCNLWLGVSVENQRNDYRYYDYLRKIPAAKTFISYEPLLSHIETHFERTLYRKPDWTIIGCESGPKRRECKIDWVRDIVNQCKAASVPVFVKQLSINGKVEHDMTKFPSDLQYQELPK